MQEIMNNYFPDEYFPLEDGSERIILDVSSNARTKHAIQDLKPVNDNADMSYRVRVSYEANNSEDGNIQEYYITRSDNNYEVNYVSEQKDIKRILILPFRVGFEWRYEDNHPIDQITECKVASIENIIIGRRIISNCIRVEYKKSKRNVPFLFQWYAKKTDLLNISRYIKDMMIITNLYNI